MFLPGYSSFISRSTFAAVKFIPCDLADIIQHILGQCIDLIICLKIFGNKSSCPLLGIYQYHSALPLFVTRDEEHRRYDNHWCRHFPRSSSSPALNALSCKIPSAKGLRQIFPRQTIKIFMAQR